MGVGTAPAKGPFVFTFPMGEARGGDERVTIELRDGTRVEGRLLDFGERAGVLKACEPARPRLPRCRREGRARGGSRRRPIGERSVEQEEAHPGLARSGRGDGDRDGRPAHGRRRPAGRGRRGPGRGREGRAGRCPSPSPGSSTDRRFSASTARSTARGRSSPWNEASRGTLRGRDRRRRRRDRYANLDVSLLLYHIDRFRGLVMRTTNVIENVDDGGRWDDAFLRRFRFILEFAVPDRGARRLLWRKLRGSSFRRRPHSRRRRFLCSREPPCARRWQRAQRHLAACGHESTSTSSATTDTSPSSMFVSTIGSKSGFSGRSRMTLWCQPSPSFPTGSFSLS